MSVDSYVIALKTLFDPDAAEGLTAGYNLCLGEDRYSMRVAEGRLEVTRGEAPAPDATIATAPSTMADVLWHERPLAEALRSGEVEIEGDREAVTRFLGLFPLPDPAPAPGAA
jgi:alkyl sulfatase BDS1-like metallo-beta-lactamase superfamily hydrolase